MRLVFGWLSSVLSGLRARTRRVGGKRRRAVFGLTTVVAAGVLALFVGAAIGSAPNPNVIGDPSAFEANDGNMTLETTGALDWNCLTTPPDLMDSTGTCGTNNGSYLHNQDLAAGTTSTTTGDLGWKSGQKQDVVCPVIVHGSNPGKDTFTDVASYNNVALSSLTNKVDTFLYGATIRQTANGTANENVELQQGTGGTCAGEPSGVNLYKRVAGDKLIEINYNGSSTAPTFSVATWLAPNSAGSCQAGGSPGASGCWSTTSALGGSFATGATNASAISIGDNGIQVGDAISTTDPTGGPQQLVANKFAEFGIDLTGSGVVSQTSCTGFAQTVWESRSSASFSSNPEDIELEGHNFSTCQPATINIVKLDSVSGSGIAGAVFDEYAGDPATGPSLGSCTTNTSGDCTLPQLTGTGTSTFTVKETTAPNGYNAAASQTCSITFKQTAQNPACTLTFNDTPQPGQINIHKADPAGNPIQGAVFTLYTDDGTAVSGGDSATNPDSDDHIAPPADATSVTCTTNAAGNCSFQNVVLGTYTVFETATPAGYETANAQTVTVGLGSSPGTGDVENMPTFTDPYAPATIKVLKKDGSANPLGGAGFTLYQGSSTSGTVLGTCTTDATTGGCSLGNVNITQGSTFTLAETTTPNGYTTAASQTFTVTWTTASQTVTKTFTDSPVPGTITIQKNDANGAALQGAVFGLYTDDGTTVTGGDSTINPDSDDHAVMSGGSPVTCTTNASGQCSFTNVALGSYRVFETATPAGYQTAMSQTATIGLGPSANTGATLPLTFTDPYATATINVTKVDASNNPLAGATFTLYQGTSTSGTVLKSCTTDSTGGCSLGSVNVTQGTKFTVAETQAPDGYSAGLPQTITVIWSNVTQTIPVSFTDTPVAGTITIQKNDANNKALAGAVFGLYTDDGSPVSGGDSTINPDNDDHAVMSSGSPVTCTTNGAGQCSFTNVALGSYTVFETATPAGYQTATAQTVTIGLGGSAGTGQTVPLTFTDPYAPADITIIKQDPSGNAVAGAGFTLYQGDSTSGTVLGSCTTDATGDCDLGNVNVTQGTDFTVAETTTPNGYTTAASQTITVVWLNTPQTVPVTFTDVPVPGTINVQKFDDASPANPLNGATFTLYKEPSSEPSGDSATVPDTDDTPVTIGGNAATCTTAGGVCSIANVPLGKYVLFETTTPTGYQTAPAQDVTIALGPAANTGDTETLTFTDPRLHKEIVLVCSEGTNTLDSSSVTVDGGATQQSLDQGATLPTGVTEAKLCGLGGATKSDLPDGASSSVQVTVH